jgi:hypothetical protein
MQVVSVCSFSASTNYIPLQYSNLKFTSEIVNSCTLYKTPVTGG